MQMEDLKAQLRLQQEKNGGTFVVQDEWVRVQAALESKETRLEEIEAQFEEKEKQFRQFQELYSRTEEELEYERSQHSLTKVSFHFILWGSSFHPAVFFSII